MTRVPLKRLVDPSRPITYGIVQAGDNVNDGVPYIRPVDMNGHSGVEPATLLRTSPEIAASYARSSLKAGDIVISIGPSFGKTMIVPEELTGANLTQGTARVAVSPEVDVRFLVWALQAAETLAHWEQAVGGATFRALNLGPLANTPISLLPISQQHAIANFLDRETAKIDTLIATQAQLIATLREDRAATITQAITKGLDPEAAMSASHFQGLPTFPTGWVVTPLKHVCVVRDCKHLTAEFVDDGFALASIREVQSRYVDVTHAKRTTETYYRQLGEGGRSPQVGDLIFSRNATVGEVAQVAPQSEPFAMGQDVCLLRPEASKLDPNYAWYVLRSMLVGTQIELMVIGSTFKRINVEEIKSLVITCPPLIEQRQIVEFLDDRCGSIDALVAKAQNVVEILSEYRSALISDAVTGKIDVCGAA